MATDADARVGEGGCPRLFADTMLGRLARALRLLGLDTTYARIPRLGGSHPPPSSGGSTIAAARPHLFPHRPGEERGAAFGGDRWTSRWEARLGIPRGGGFWYADEDGRARALEQAILTGRAILTRDRRLNAYGCRRVLVVSDHWEEQLAQVLDELGLERGSLPAFSRCSRCNREIIAVTRDEVRDIVPPFVFATHKEFHRCPGCGRVYWAGTHVARMQRRLGVAPK